MQEDIFFRLVLAGSIFVSGILVAMGWFMPDIHNLLIPAGIVAFLFFTYGLVFDCIDNYKDCPNCPNSRENLV